MGDSFQSITNNHEDDSIYHYNIVLGDFNCILNKKVDKYPTRRTDDIGKTELQNLSTSMIYMMHRESLTQIKKRYSFHVLILFYVQMVYAVKSLIQI